MFNYLINCEILLNGAVGQIHLEPMTKWFDENIAKNMLAVKEYLSTLDLTMLKNLHREMSMILK